MADCQACWRGQLLSCQKFLVSAAHSAWNCSEKVQLSALGDFVIYDSKRISHLKTAAMAVASTKRSERIRCACTVVRACTTSRHWLELRKSIAILVKQRHLSVHISCPLSQIGGLQPNKQPWKHAPLLLQLFRMRPVQEAQMKDNGKRQESWGRRTGRWSLSMTSSQAWLNSSAPASMSFKWTFTCVTSN